MVCGTTPRSFILKSNNNDGHGLRFAWGRRWPSLSYWATGTGSRESGASGSAVQGGYRFLLVCYQTVNSNRRLRGVRPGFTFCFSFLFLAKLMVVCRAPSSNNRKPIPRVRCDRTALREREIGENLTERALYGIKQGRQFSTLYGTSEVGKF